MGPAQAPPLSPARLVAMQAAIDDHRLAPDGAWAVYVRRTVVRGEYRRHLWRVPFAGGRARRLTEGRVDDTAAEISPDGRWIAFLRRTADLAAGETARTSQPWIMPATGGRPRRLARLPHGASGLAWSPTGDRLAILAAEAAERTLVGRTRKGLAPLARRITRMDVRDDTGFRDHREHLWLLDRRPGARPVQLTRGDFDVESPAWSPDGQRIAFAADFGPDAGLDPRSVLAAVTVATGAVETLAELRGELTAPAWSPDGRWLAAIGTDVADPPEATQRELWLVEVATGQGRSLTSGLDLPVGVWASTHLARSTQPQGPGWLDERALAVLVTRRGRALPWRIGVDGTAEPMAPLEGRIVAAGLQVAAGRITVNAQVDAMPHELHAVESGGLRRITTNGAAWRRRIPAPRLDEIELPGPAGPIQAWAYAPAGHDGANGGPLPAILDLHGGPTGSWGPGPALDVLALTARGYRVVRPNIRGSAGFGRNWVEGLGAAWGDADAADALAVADGLVSMGLADPRRLGVMGLSYGGFLTSWLVGVTDRFAAAVTENGVTNQLTAWAECYFGIYDSRRTGLGDPLSPEGVEALWSRSPLRNVAAIRTPLLMLQAEEDRVCPASDNVQLFAALRALGREVEYVLYPEEHHVFQSIGRPDRRIDRLERVLDWFGRHIGPDRPEADGAATPGTFGSAAPRARRRSAPARAR